MKKTSLFASLMCVLIRKALPLLRGSTPIGGRGLLRHAAGKCFTLILLFATIATSVFAADGMLPGTGTEADPYLIEDVNDFDVFADSANATTYWAAGVHTKLMTDIDLAGRTYTTAIIAPDTSIPFSGNFDGNSHVIVNLEIEKSGDFNGLFGWISGLSNNDILVQDLDLSNPNIIISIGGYTGALVGKMQNCKIDNCHTINGAINSTNDIDSTTIGGLVGYCIDATLSNSTSSTEVIGGWKGIGGLVGRVDSGILTDCSASGNLSEADDGIGGLVGDAYLAYITNCYSTGVIRGANMIGGLVGYNFSGSIANCYTSGIVYGNYDVGGICGKNLGDSGTILNSYSSCTVNGNNTVGGLCGTNTGNATNSYSIGDINGNGVVGGLIGDNPGSITKCYSVSKVSGNFSVGGIVGSYSNNVIDCFWDVDISGTIDGVGNQTPDPPGVTGITTVEMQTQSTFTGWDFTTPVWMMLRPGEDYPRLAWQEIFDGDIAGLYGVDMVDFAYLANYWGMTGCSSGTDCGRADIDGSGEVDLPDLAAVANDWLR